MQGLLTGLQWKFHYTRLHDDCCSASTPSHKTAHATLLLTTATAHSLSSPLPSLPCATSLPCADCPHVARVRCSAVGFRHHVPSSVALISAPTMSFGLLHIPHAVNSSIHAVNSRRDHGLQVIVLDVQERGQLNIHCSQILCTTASAARSHAVNSWLLSMHTPCCKFRNSPSVWYCASSQVRTCPPTLRPVSQRAEKQASKLDSPIVIHY